MLQQRHSPKNTQAKTTNIPYLRTFQNIITTNMKNISILFLFLSLSLQVFAQEESNIVPTEPNAICPILIGEKIPEGTVTNLDNKEVEVTELTKDKPSVIIFYRGGWCSYCTNQLSGLNEIEKEMDELGFQVLAISQDDVAAINETKEEKDLDYNVVSDPEMKFAQKMGVAYKMDEKTIKRYKGYGIDLKGSGYQLPAPAVFVVDKEGIIQFTYVNPNYSVRLSPEVLLAVLKTVK